MNTRYLTLDEAIAIHDSMIELYGGSFGIRDLGLLQSALSRPESSFAGNDLYPTLFDKAASLFHSLIFNHAFVDGNKRSSMVCMARFLSMNGYNLSISNSEFVEFPLYVTKNHLSIAEIASWIEKNTT